MFKKVNIEFWKRIVRRSGADQQVEAMRGMEGAREAIVRVLGEENAAEIRPKYIKKRVLFLESTHPAISAEVKRVEQNIIAAVNNKLGRPEVVSIQFVLPYR